MSYPWCPTHFHGGSAQGTDELQAGLCGQEDSRRDISQRKWPTDHPAQPAASMPGTCKTMHLSRESSSLPSSLAVGRAWADWNILHAEKLMINRSRCLLGQLHPLGSKSGWDSASSMLRTPGQGGTAVVWFSSRLPGLWAGFGS